eukprot:8162526-Alexandrium_andersonii.AAC.1
MSHSAGSSSACCSRPAAEGLDRRTCSGWTMVPMTGAPSMRPWPRTRHMSRPMELGPSKIRRHSGGKR